MDQLLLPFTNPTLAAAMFYVFIGGRVIANLTFYVMWRRADRNRNDPEALRVMLLLAPIEPAPRLLLALFGQFITLNFMGVWSWLVTPFLAAQIFFLFKENVMSLVERKSRQSNEYWVAEFPRLYFRTWIFEMIYVAVISAVFFLKL